MITCREGIACWHKQCTRGVCDGREGSGSNKAAWDFAVDAGRAALRFRAAIALASESVGLGPGSGYCRSSGTHVQNDAMHTWPCVWHVWCYGHVANKDAFSNVLLYCQPTASNYNLATLQLKVYRALAASNTLKIPLTDKLRCMLELCARARRTHVCNTRNAHVHGTLHAEKRKGLA